MQIKDKINPRQQLALDVVGDLRGRPTRRVAGETAVEVAIVEFVPTWSLAPVVEALQVERPRIEPVKSEMRAEPSKSESAPELRRSTD